MEKKIGQAVWRIFIACAALTLLIAIVLCVLKSQDDILVVQVIKKPFYFFALFFAAGLLLSKVEPFLKKHGRLFLILFLTAYGITVYVLGVLSRGIPVNDSGVVYQGAQYMAGLSEEIVWQYFARWHNNIMPMMYLGFLFRIAVFFGIKDPWYFAVAVNTVYVLIALYCVFWLGSRRERHGTASGWLGMLMLALYFPIFGHTQSMYTDAFSFCYGIGGFCLWLRNQESGRKGVKYQLGNVLAGLVWAVGAQLKMTIVISLVAVVCYQLLFGGLKEFLRRCTAAILLVTAVAVGCSCYIKTLPSREYENAWGMPFVGYLIALGLERDGSFDLESEYFNGVCGEEGRDKWLYTKAYIWEHKGNFFDREHVVSKLRHNFASGTMIASDFLWTAEREGFVYQCISYWGEYRVPYRTWITGYWYMVLGLGVVAWFSRAVLCRGKEDVVVFTAILSMFGIMLYAMIGEANNRQMYNHLPWFFCVANMGMWVLQDLFHRGVAYITAKRSVKESAGQP